MRRLIAIGTITILLGALACSIALSQGTGQVWLGGFPLLRIRCAVGGYTIDQRVDALQTRANNLLELENGVSAVTVRKSGADAIIYTDSTLFVTVTTADARANASTTEELASIWAQRLRANLPQATPEKPGVGLPGHPSGSGASP